MNESLPAARQSGAEAVIAAFSSILVLPVCIQRL